MLTLSDINVSYDGSRILRGVTPRSARHQRQPHPRRCLAPHRGRALWRCCSRTPHTPRVPPLTPRRRPLRPKMV